MTAYTYTVAVFVDGFLPESEPFITDDLTAAIAAWRNEMRHTLDNTDDDGVFLDNDTRLHHTSNATIADSVRAFGVYTWNVAGVLHSIERN